MSGPRRGGRRPGKPDTRGDILRAARDRFAEVGYERASIRSIAAAAGVDPALVHHYFGTKQRLMASAVRIPADPEAVLAQLRAAPDDALGETLVRVIVGLWDSPLGPTVVAAFRSVLAGSEATLIRGFLEGVALAEVRVRVDSPAGTGAARVALAASHMIGILVARKIVGIEPVSSMPLPELVAHCAPAIQNYLTGPWTPPGVPPAPGGPGAGIGGPAPTEERA